MAFCDRLPQAGGASYTQHTGGTNILCMSLYTINDDPTIPPPGRRTGKGAESVVPYLKKSIASKPKAGDRDESRPGTKASPRPMVTHDEDYPVDFRL